MANPQGPSDAGRQFAPPSRQPPSPANDSDLPVYHLRDIPMPPERGVRKAVEWRQFTATVQLRLPLDRRTWAGVEDRDFEVKLSSDEVQVRCKSRKEAVGLQDLNGKLKRVIKPELCWFALEKDHRDPSGQSKVFTLELAKESPGVSWNDGVYVEQMFNRKHFGWGPNAAQEEEAKYTSLKPGRRKDINDTFVTSRGWLCNEFEQGQTDEVLSFRLILDQKRLDAALEKVPYYSIFGIDVSERFLKVFIRGDEFSPILLGKLGGACLPDCTTVELTSVTREVYGHRLGAMERLPCFDIIVVKAPDFMYEWEEPLQSGSAELTKPVASLEDWQAQQATREPSPDRDDWTPDDWADEQKEKADKTFKEGQFRDAVVYYTRALRFTPLNEKLLSNRSACYLKISKCQLALDDAVKAQEQEPTWSKIYFRKGQALRGLKRWQDALDAFSEGKELDSENPGWDQEAERTLTLKVAYEERKNAAKK